MEHLGSLENGLCTLKTIPQLPPFRMLSNRRTGPVDYKTARMAQSGLNNVPWPWFIVYKKQLIWFQEHLARTILSNQ